MFQKRIRRLFIDNRVPDFDFISSRKIISFLFSPERLQVTRDNPERWLRANITDIDLTRAEIVDDNYTATKILRLIGTDLEDCLVTLKERNVVTRWDLIIKAHGKTGFKINEERIGNHSDVNEKEVLR
jgi:hypothetical protein